MPGYPCCCPEGDCVFVNDDFSTDTLSTSYTQSSGSWTYDGTNDYIYTSSADAIVLHDTGHPDSVLPIVVTGRIRLTLNDVGRLIAASNSGNTDYLYAEIERTSSSNVSVKVYTVISSTPAQVGTTNNLTISTGTNEWVDVKLCWDGVALLAFIGQGSVYEADTGEETTFTTGGYLVGFGVGTGTVECDDLWASKHYVTDNDCANCTGECDVCGGTVPSVMQLTIANLTGTCTCSNLEGTFICYRIEDDAGVDYGCRTHSAPLATCRWYSDWITYSEPGCGFYRYRAAVIYLTFVDGVTTKYSIVGRLELDTGVTETAQVETTPTTSPMSCTHTDTPINDLGCVSFGAECQATAPGSASDWAITTI